jgi:hypothetical protein
LDNLSTWRGQSLPCGRDGSGIGHHFRHGATDAANAIAEAVGTRSISVDAAIAMSVICNFVGLVAMSFISTAVADTISGMVDFGGDTHAALIALAAATVGIVTCGVWELGSLASPQVRAMHSLRVLPVRLSQYRAVSKVSIWQSG